MCKRSNDEEILSRVQRGLSSILVDFRASFMSDNRERTVKRVKNDKQQS